MKVFFVAVIVYIIFLNQFSNIKTETKSYHYDKELWWEIEQQSTVYCNKESGECFFQEFVCQKESSKCYINELEPTESYPDLSSEDLLSENYERILLNVYPVFHIGSDINITPNETQPQEHILLANEIEKNGFRFYKQTEKFTDGEKLAEYTGYGTRPSWIIHRHGMYRRWHPNGQKQLDADFRYGKLWGKATVWYESGVVQKKVHYVANKLHGLAQYYDEGGELMYEYLYNQGKIIDKKVYKQKQNN